MPSRAKTFSEMPPAEQKRIVAQIVVEYRDNRRTIPYLAKKFKVSGWKVYTILAERGLIRSISESRAEGGYKILALTRPGTISRVLSIAGREIEAAGLDPHQPIGATIEAVPGALIVLLHQHKVGKALPHEPVARAEA